MSRLALTKDRHYIRFAAMDKRQFIAAQGGVCFYCGKPFTKADKPTRDHLFPRCSGNVLYLNKVIAHKSCNNRKGGRAPTREEVERAKVVYTILGLPSWRVGEAA